MTFQVLLFPYVSLQESVHFVNSVGILVDVCIIVNVHILN